MVTFHDITGENIKKKHSTSWPQIPDHLRIMLIIGESGSIKTNALPNFTNRQPGVDKIYLYAKKIHIKQKIDC